MTERSGRSSNAESATLRRYLQEISRYPPLNHEEEIELARQFRRDGLVWEPQPGNYVYDETGFCKQPSPFQDRVYFILNCPYFMKAVGGVDRFKEIMTWLPTWDDARDILRSLRVSDDRILEHLRRERAIENGRERVVLYEMIASALRSEAGSAAPGH